MAVSSPNIIEAITVDHFFLKIKTILRVVHTSVLTRTFVAAIFFVTLSTACKSTQILKPTSELTPPSIRHERIILSANKMPWTKSSLSVGKNDVITFTLNGSHRISPGSEKYSDGRGVYFKIGDGEISTIFQAYFNAHHAKNNGNIYLAVRDWRVEGRSVPENWKRGNRIKVDKDYYYYTNWYNDNSGSYVVDIFVADKDKQNELKGYIESLQRMNPEDELLSKLSRNFTMLSSSAGLEDNSSDQEASPPSLVASAESAVSTSPSKATAASAELGNTPAAPVPLQAQISAPNPSQETGTQAPPPATTVVIPQEKRVALVVGNAAYAVSPLRNPVSDAEDVGAALKRLGFTVILATNTSRRDFEQAISQFYTHMQGSDVGLFYYAGHGMQISGSNYLVPVDAKIETESDVTFECVDVGRILGKMEDAKSPLNIVLLDACRDNPFALGFRSTARGLAKMDAPIGTYIAYATSPGKTAADGVGRNGLFTEKLLRYLAQPGLKIEEIMKKVRIEVNMATQGRQAPWDSSSLMGDFYFSLEQKPQNPPAN